MISQETLSKESNELFKQSHSECFRILDQLPTAEPSNQDELRRIGIAKKNLLESTELCGQIIQTLDVGSLLLGLIGQRALLESLINTKYAFAHPQKADTKIEWAYKVCADYFERGNDPRARKNNLNDIGRIQRRAEETGLSDIYEITYGGLCNFGHMLIHSGWCNKPETRAELMSKYPCMCSSLGLAVPSAGVPIL